MQKPTTARIFLVFLRMGCFAFGPGAIELIRREFVERRRWLTQAEFEARLAIASIVPGPFQVSLVAATAYSSRGFLGGVVGLLAFCTPGIALVVMLATVLSDYRVEVFLQTHAGIFKGIGAAIIALLANTFVRLGREKMRQAPHWIFVGAVLLILWHYAMPSPLVIIGAGFIYAGVCFFQRRIFG